MQGEDEQGTAEKLTTELVTVSILVCIFPRREPGVAPGRRATHRESVDDTVSRPLHAHHVANGSPGFHRYSWRRRADIASTMLTLDNSIEAVGKVLGHGDVRVTRVDARVLDETSAAAVAFPGDLGARTTQRHLEAMVSSDGP